MEVLGVVLGAALSDGVTNDCPGAARGVPATSSVQAATHAAAMTTPESTCATLRTATRLTYTSSDVQLFDQRIDNHTQITVVLLGDPSLTLIGRAPTGNFGHQGELIGAVQ